MARVPVKGGGKQTAKKGPKNLLFNIGGVGLLVLGVVMAVKSSFTPKPQTPVCEARYNGGVLFSYAKQGKGALSPEDLQARLGGTDRGLIKNASIVEDARVASGYALEVQLKRSSGEEDDQSRSGIGFTWLPNQLPLSTAACLSYSVWIPEDFKLGGGGTLPGLVSDVPGVDEAPRPSEAASADTTKQDAGKQDVGKLRPFSVTPQWRGDGSLMLWQATNIGPAGAVVIDPAIGGLKPGQWVRIEAEAVLNTPNRADGILRAWINGKLAVERFNMGYRRDENQSFQAILGDVHHLNYGGWAPAPSETRLRISALELRLK